MIMGYLESNDDENSTYQNLWHEAKTMLRGEYIYAVNMLLYYTEKINKTLNSKSYNKKNKIIWKKGEMLWNKSGVQLIIKQ